MQAEASFHLALWQFRSAASNNEAVNCLHDPEAHLLSMCPSAVQQSWGAMGEGESDELKRVLLEGNPIYLAITFVVSLLHSVFDFFAFKNDIGFWRNKKSVEGLSVRTVGINCFCQVSQRRQRRACLICLVSRHVGIM